MSNKIIHIDMDCFYAAVEMRDNPALVGLPVAVGGKPDRRGVLTTCNYAARKFGLHSAMPTAHALRLCPQLIILPVQMDKYRQVSQQIHAIFRRYTDIIEPLSLDEAYLDVSAGNLCQGSATLLAQRIRADIKQELRLTASAGIAANKFLAKVASDWCKPDGQFTIAPAHVDNFMQHLPVSKIPGVGKVTANKLYDEGYHTCGQLRLAEQEVLVRLFGKFGQRLYLYCRGIDERAVNPNRLRKSISVEHTFLHDLLSLTACAQELPQLFASLQTRLLKHQQREIHKQFVKIKFADFNIKTKECVASELNEAIYLKLLQTMWQQINKPVRLLGVGVRFTEQPEQVLQPEFW